MSFISNIDTVLIGYKNKYPQLDGETFGEWEKRLTKIAEEVHTSRQRNNRGGNAYQINNMPRLENRDGR